MNQAVFTSTTDPKMERALRLLAGLGGSALRFDDYTARLEGVPFPLTKDEFLSALRALEHVGLAAWIYERLDGPIWALTRRGRGVAESMGFAFDTSKVETTLKLFKEWKCETEI